MEWYRYGKITFLGMVVVALLSNGGSKYQLPFFSITTWTTPSSFPFSVFSSDDNSTSSSRHPPLEINPRTALYPWFNSPKMNKAVENLAKLNEEELLKRRGKERDIKMEKIEADLMRARSQIRDAIIESRRYSSPPPTLVEDADYVPRGDIYRNAYVFQRSYLLMESMFKIFVYEEGEPPLFHNGPTTNIYSSEGLFIRFIESSTQFRTRDADEAHVYFLPFSVVMILQYLFDPVVRDKAVLGRVVEDYVRLVSTKYGYWNRSLGADHFMLSCHDWGPRSTWYVHQLYFTSMRVLCNANTSEFFNPRKDVSFPEINLQTSNLTSLTLNSSSSSPPSNRTILAFFAGQQSGKIRPFLFKHWHNKDEDIKIYERFPTTNSSFNYKQMMASSKFCLCPSGHEVASPRIVEAIYSECVPVLISKDYVLPFSEVLDWDKFSVSVPASELSELKRILTRIGDEEYEKLLRGVREVQRHFVLHDPPKRYDVFSMMVHSLWLRRLNLRISA